MEHGPAAPPGDTAPMSDSLGDARRALRQGEVGEALVHLWNALEQARGTNDPETLTRIAALAQQVEEEGDEGERAEAVRLLEELGEAAADVTAEEPGQPEEEWAPGGEPAGETERPQGADVPAEPADDAEEANDEEQPRSRRGAALGWLIPIAIFLFFTLRDVLS